MKAANILRKGRILTTIPYLSKEYAIEFQVYPTVFHRGWHNVLHFTTGRNGVAYGSRIPAMFFNNNRFWICSDISGNRNCCYASPTVKVKKWIKVRVSQSKEGKYYYYKVEINGKQVKKVRNSKPRVFKNVKVFASDKWYAPQQGYLG